MMSRLFYIVLISVFGFFATPTLSYACGTKNTNTEKSCCKKSKTEKNSKKDCCKRNNSKSDKDNSGCDGKCNNSNCSCPTVHFAFALTFYAEIKAKTYFTESKKTKLYYNENCLS
ncbi:MAG: hypothetical protein ACK5BH_11995, partial [Bacteroidota bacterium]